MAHARAVLIHFERDDGSVTHSTMSGSQLSSVVAGSEAEAEALMVEKLKELGAHSFEFV